MGHEQEGFQLANEVFDKDAYNVVAHNLVTLQGHLEKYQTLGGDGIIVRMESREARIYGDSVLELLHLAKEHLCAKYDVTLDEPVIVEIFPQQQDFAIRTFGLPGGAGFLGVCFGRVITVNSPASQGENPSNWRSVLWHEFCHVVTLRKTHNKMPRWLSEGISVYEERQRNPAWGQTMTPQYREMVLGKDLTPVSRLSGAFLRPASPMHLQFAYYESSLVVEFLVQKHGLDTIKQVLDDLAVGMLINESLGRYTGSMEQLDQEFAAFARDRAQGLSPNADWKRPETSTPIELTNDCGMEQGASQQRLGNPTLCTTFAGRENGGELQKSHSNSSFNCSPKMADPIAPTGCSLSFIVNWTKRNKNARC